jgi:hypothetical protein
MSRPINISPSLYAELLSRFQSMSPEQLHRCLLGAGYDLRGLEPTPSAMRDLVLQSPARFLAHEVDILGSPDLLAGLFIEFDDGELDAEHTYLIDREAAEEIAAGDENVLLRSGGEGFLVPRERIARALANGCTLDYRESS